MARSLCRREFMRSAGLAVSGALLAACQPKVVEVEKIVKETVEVEKVVEKIIKETVIVKGTPSSREGRHGPSRAKGARRPSFRGLG